MTRRASAYIFDVPSLWRVCCVRCALYALYCVLGRVHVAAHVWMYVPAPVRDDQSDSFPRLKSQLGSLRTGIMAGSICPIEVWLSGVAASRPLRSQRGLTAGMPPMSHRS